MLEPTLQYLDVPGPHAKHSTERRIAWWDWNATGQQQPDHVVVCVHGLTRQSRDFDALATALAPHARVVCVDVAGRGHSDWLHDPMQYQIPTYVTDLAVVLGHVRQTYASTTGHDPATLAIDWVGTSMGGLIGMALAAVPLMGVRRLVLNDVGIELPTVALQRIADFVGNAPAFASEQAAAAYLREVSPGFGPHTPEQWLALSRPMLRATAEGWVLHYDPAIATPFRATVPDQASAGAEGNALLARLYDAITAPTLLLRGAESDLLHADTAHRMTQRGPRARCVEFAGVGHAPTLVQPEQIAVVTEFLLAP